MKIVSSKPHVRLVTGLLGALFALGCGNTDPARPDSPNPDAIEHADPSVEPDASAGSADANKAKTTDDFSAKTTETKSTSRVVGYLQTFHSLEPSTIDLDALTHLILAFAGPKPTQAGLTIDFENENPNITKLIAAAHLKNVKVLGAIGGGTSGGLVTDALKLDSDAVVGAALTFLHRYELDGIDIDIENEAIDPETYEKLVTGLVAGRPAGKLLTAAVGNYKRENYRALDKLSFLSVMSYDRCGAWGEERCPHSPYSQAERDLEFWSTEYWQQAGVVYDKANIVLGVPFYGHCWGEGCLALKPFDESPALAEVTNSPSYSEVLAFWNKDTGRNGEPVPDFLEDDAHTYYLTLNGPQTIERKALLAKNYGGVMIWELGHDAPGASSLLSLIQKTR